MTIDINKLKSKVDTFNTGDVASSAQSLFGESLQNNEIGDLISGLMDGTLSTDDTEKATGLLAKYALESYFAGNPVALLFSPVAQSLGESIGTVLANFIPTDMELFPSPLSSPPPKPKDNTFPGYGDVKGAIDDEINKLKKEINLDSLTQSAYDELDNLLPKDEDFDEQMDKLEQFIDNPKEALSSVITNIYDSTLTRLQSSQSAIKGKLESQLNNMKSKNKNIMQENKILAKQNDFIILNYKNTFDDALTTSKQAGMNMIDDKLSESGLSSEELQRLTNAKNDIMNLNVTETSSDIFKSVAKDEIKLLNKSINNMKKIKVEINDVVLEYNKKKVIDEQMVEKNEKTKKIKEFVSFGKSLIKILRILKTMKSTLNPVMTKMTSASITVLGNALPNFNQSELLQLSKSTVSQLPNDTKILQENGLDNLQTQADDIMSDLNYIKDR